jgi:hypothetical protein
MGLFSRFCDWPFQSIRSDPVNSAALLVLSAGVACTATNEAQDMTSSRRSISYHTVEIDGLDVFYREAGPADAATVLLHGFPSSSRMWEPL